MAVIGFDIGTTSLKAVMYETDGKYLGAVMRQYQILNPHAGYFELSPNDIGTAALNALEELLSATGVRHIDAISATSFGESTVLLDEHDEPIANILLYMDERGIRECHEFKDICNARRFFTVTGEVPHPMLSIYKLKALQRSGRLKRLCKIYFVADYVLHLFGGDHYTDYSLAARTGMLDIRKYKWWPEGFAYLNINENCFPVIVSSGSQTGTISSALRHKLCVTGDAVIIIGGHDQVIASLGAGVLRAGEIMNGLGSVDNMTVVYHSNQISSNFFDLNFCVMPYISPDLFASYLYNFSGGNLIRWFKTEFMKDVAEEAKALKKNPYAVMDKLIPPDPTGLLVTPHFSGTGTPDLNIKAKGIIAGLTFQTTREELYRAILEGEALDMKMNLDCLETAGITPEYVITVGGGSKSDSWMQIRADVFGKEIRVYDNSEAGTKGSAMLAMKKMGMFKTYEEAHINMTRGHKVYYPNIRNVKIYNEKYLAYKELYKTTEHLYN
jgi:xylulokinase